MNDDKGLLEIQREEKISVELRWYRIEKLVKHNFKEVSCGVLTRKLLMNAY